MYSANSIYNYLLSYIALSFLYNECYNSNYGKRHMDNCALDCCGICTPYGVHDEHEQSGERGEGYY